MCMENSLNCIINNNCLLWLPVIIIHKHLDEQMIVNLIFFKSPKIISMQIGILQGEHYCLICYACRYKIKLFEYSHSRLHLNNYFKRINDENTTKTSRPRISAYNMAIIQLSVIACRMDGYNN